MGMWLIFWVITNVATSFYDIDIEPHFYYWGYAWPLHQSECSRGICYGSRCSDMLTPFFDSRRRIKTDPLRSPFTSRIELWHFGSMGCCWYRPVSLRLLLYAMEAEEGYHGVLAHGLRTG
jgi:hypothetical protein